MSFALDAGLCYKTSFLKSFPRRPLAIGFKKQTLVVCLRVLLNVLLTTVTVVDTVGLVEVVTVVVAAVVTLAEADTAEVAVVVIV